MTMTAGTIFLMWLGEQIDEFGIGNGISLLIFAGIVANLPQALFQMFSLVRTGAMSGVGMVAIMALAVGVILLISSQRGEQIISNLSSWYVEPQWRTHSTLLISMATKLKHVTYLNASPAPHTWRTLQAQGFKPYNFGRSIVFGLPGRGTVSEIIPDGLPEAQLLRDHRELGMTALVVERDGIVSPFVFKPRRLDKPPMPVMDVMFARSPQDFHRCLPALARHFLPRSLGFLIDGDMPGTLSHYAEGKEPRYFKGPYRPVLGDLAYTEKVLFG
jgi:hypothetical protein